MITPVNTETDELKSHRSHGGQTTKFSVTPITRQRQCQSCSSSCNAKHSVFNKLAHGKQYLHCLDRLVALGTVISSIDLTARADLHMHDEDVILRGVSNCWKLCDTHVHVSLPSGR